MVPCATPRNTGFLRAARTFSEVVDQNPPATEGAHGESLAKRLFLARVDVVNELDAQQRDPNHALVLRDSANRRLEAPSIDQLRSETAELLRREVAAMNVDNFVVRPKRQFVDKFATPAAWKVIDESVRHELAEHVAGLPTELDPEAEEAKRFDLLMLNLQLALLRHKPAFERLRKQVVAIAGLLEEKATIPLVQAQLPLIQALQTDEWWQDITVPMLEVVRRRLRDLVVLIEKSQRKPLFTNFADVMGPETEIALLADAPGDDLERFRAKARAFLRQHEDHLAVRRVRMNQPLTASDLSELERMLVASGTGSPDVLLVAATESHGLGLFVRSLVGLDRAAAKQAFGPFAQALGGDQIEFVDMIVDHLTEHGVMDPGLLYESPFTDHAPTGPADVLGDEGTARVINVLARIRSNALAA